MTSRETLAPYETPEALALLAEHGWPEWVDRLGHEWRLRYHGKRWWYEYRSGKQWIPGDTAPDRAALCILRDDLRVLVNAGGVGVHYDGRRWALQAVHGFWTGGGWTRDYDNPDVIHYDIYDAALLAGLAALQEQGESR